MFTRATGVEVTVAELLKAGERIWSIERLYNLREGFTRKDDRLPKRFAEPLTEGPHQGQAIDENAQIRLLADYYAVRGWDAQETSRRIEGAIGSDGFLGAWIDGADVDGDGVRDLLLTSPLWSDGLGTVVRVHVGGKVFSKVHDGQSGYISQSAKPLYFGLGPHAKAQKVVVEWLSGAKQTIENPTPVDGLLVIEEQ